MSKSTKERQDAWKQKQKSELGKKSISIMVSAYTKALIDIERKRTGESIAGVIERSITALLKPDAYTSYDHNKLKKLVQDDLEIKTLCQFIQRRYESGKELYPLADLFNKWGKQNFVSDNEWSEDDLKVVVDFVTSNRWLVML